MTRQRLQTTRHDFVAAKGQHYLAVCLPFYDGPRVARCYLTAARIYTRALAFDKVTGRLAYGVWRGEALGASEHVLRASDVIRAAVWGAWGWERVGVADGETTYPQWRMPAHLPSLDGSAGVISGPPHITL